MGTWIKHGEGDLLPHWIIEDLPSVCVYCKSPIINFFNDDYRCTNRKCSNPNCCSFIAAKGDFMMHLIGEKGVAFKTCLDVARCGGYENHLKLLQYFGIKPKVSLGTYLRMHCFDGVDSAFDNICAKEDAYTLDELYTSYTGSHLDILLRKKELLYSNLQYVQLEERPFIKRSDSPIKEFNVMITGTPIGFNSKEEFVNQINSVTKGLIRVYHQKSKRKTGVDFLIREPGSMTRGKVEAAISGGIQIITSSEFIAYITNIIEEYNRTKSM